MADPQSISKEEQNKLRKEEKREELQGSVDARRVLSMPEGRRFVYRILEMCGCGVIDSDPQRVDSVGRAEPHHTYFSLGEQSVGKRIQLDLIGTVPDLFSKMYLEAMSEIGEQARRERDRAEKEEEARDDEVDE